MLERDHLYLHPISGAPIHFRQRPGGRTIDFEYLVLCLRHLVYIDILVETCQPVAFKDLSRNLTSLKIRALSNRPNWLTDEADPKPRLDIADLPPSLTTFDVNCWIIPSPKTAGVLPRNYPTLWPPPITHLSFVSKNWTDFEVYDLATGLPGMRSLTVYGKVTMTPKFVREAACQSAPGNGSVLTAINVVSMASSVMDRYPPYCHISNLVWSFSPLDLLENGTVQVYLPHLSDLLPQRLKSRIPQTSNDIRHDSYSPTHYYRQGASNPPPKRQMGPSYTMADYVRGGPNSPPPSKLPTQWLLDTQNRCSLALRKRYNCNYTDSAATNYCKCVEQPLAFCIPTTWPTTLTDLHFTTDSALHLAGVSQLPKTLKRLKFAILWTLPAARDHLCQDLLTCLPPSLESLDVFSVTKISLTAQDILKMPPKLTTLIAPQLTFPPALIESFPQQISTLQFDGERVWRDADILRLSKRLCGGQFEWLYVGAALVSGALLTKQNIEYFSEESLLKVTNSVLGDRICVDWADLTTTLSPLPKRIKTLNFSNSPISRTIRMRLPSLPQRLISLCMCVTSDRLKIPALPATLKTLRLVCDQRLTSISDRFWPKLPRNLELLSIRSDNMEHLRKGNQPPSMPSLIVVSSFGGLPQSLTALDIPMVSVAEAVFADGNIGPHLTLLRVSMVLDHPESWRCTRYPHLDIKWMAPERHRRLLLADYKKIEKTLTVFYK